MIQLVATAHNVHPRLATGHKDRQRVGVVSVVGEFSDEVIRQRLGSGIVYMANHGCNEAKEYSIRS